MAGNNGGRNPATPDNKGGASQGSSTPGSGRSAQELDSITTEALMAKLAKARDIELNLEAVYAEQKVATKKGSSSSGGSKASADERQQALRLQLCEVLSDVILNDSALAESSDAIGRLWKTCFYGRINDIRGRISKEKARAKKRQASGGSSSGGGDAEASRKMARELDSQLKQFLKEAIALYKYIIERYVKELVPLSQSQFTGTSQFSQQEGEAERRRAIISSLYRMHIHLGDLHRYSNSHRLAEECYLSAARIAPGTGNPFNQLAVVAQQSQDAQMAAALYYYARSLMASRSPFETSRSNLVRLFEGNRKWLDEHTRGDGDDRTRDIVDVSSCGMEGGGRRGKARGELAARERAALTRKALARAVDLQWDLFRGISLDDGDDDADSRIDLNCLKKKISLTVEAFGNLIPMATLSDTLLCRLVAIFAFSTLGAGNEGRPLNSDGFYAKRKKDPKWNREGIIMTNQALAFSFFLRFCAVLARDVDAVASKKDKAADSKNNKLGRIASLSPLLLGFRFVTSVQNNECEWFHGLPFFPNKDGDRTLESSSIYKFCKDSHAEFWKSIGSVANRLERMSGKNKHSNAHGDDIGDVKDFDEFRGYTPFASFLDVAATSAVSLQNDKKTKYASAEDVVAALSEAKPQGGRLGGATAEAETVLKIATLLSIADGNTRATSSDQNVSEVGGQFFLVKNPDTNAREYLDTSAMDVQDKTEEHEDKETTSPVPSPSVSSEDMGEGGNDDLSAVDGTMVQEGETVPLKMSYSEKGVGLLTPAALLASTSPVKDTVTKVNYEAMIKFPSPTLSADFILAQTRAKPLSSIMNDKAATVDANALLKQTFPSQQEIVAEPAKALLPPPPGFSIRPSLPERAQMPPANLASSAATGFSLAEFTVRQPEQNTELGSNPDSVIGSVMPQAGLNHLAQSVPSVFETLNPFFTQTQAPAPPSSFNNNLFAVNSSSPMVMNQPPGFVNLQQQPQPQQCSTSNKGGLDPTLDFLLNRGNGICPPEHRLAPSGPFDLLVPSAGAAAEPQEEDDQSESIFNFLFKSTNDDTTPRAGRPLYASGQQHPSKGYYHGMPPTKNPFAT